jgi:hypothetical protein
MANPLSNFAAQLYGTERMTRRFVGSSSRWDVYVHCRLDGLERAYLEFWVACPTTDPMLAKLIWIADSVDWETTYAMMKSRSRHFDAIEEFCAKVWRLSRELDFQMAAYCASNLWC